MVTKDRIRLASETGFSLATVIKWDKGRAVNDSTDRVLLKVAGELGLKKENEDHETDKAAP
jgi:hypothetical protein